METQTKGQRRRLAILEAAADLSTVDGLSGLSFQGIAGAVELTKAGVAAHFPSKERLQLAVVETAAEAYRAPLSEAVRQSEPGLDRLRRLTFAWLQHLETLSYRGGCFFMAAGLDFAGRPGPVRDAIQRTTGELIEMLEEQARLAGRLGELDASVPPEVLVFQIHAMAQEANLRRELLGAPDAFGVARVAVTDLFDRWEVAPSADSALHRRPKSGRRKKSTPPNADKKRAPRS